MQYCWWGFPQFNFLNKKVCIRVISPHFPPYPVESRDCLYGNSGSLSSDDGLRCWHQDGGGSDDDPEHEMCACAGDSCNNDFYSGGEGRAAAAAGMVGGVALVVLIVRNRRV